MKHHNIEDKSSSQQKQNDEEESPVCLFCGESWDDEKRIFLGTWDGWRMYPAICSECISKHANSLARMKRRGTQAKIPKCACCGEDIDKPPPSKLLRYKFTGCGTRLGVRRCKWPTPSHFRGRKSAAHQREANRFTDRVRDRILHEGPQALPVLK
jgi:hypothetical protein